MEPRLETIEDYDTLKGQKRRVVIAVIIAGVILGAAFSVAKVIFVPNDRIITTKQVGLIPLQ